MKTRKHFPEILTSASALTFAVILLLASSAAAQNQKPDEPKKTETGAEEVLEKHIAAIGGREVWRRIKTIETVSEREVFGGVSKTYRLEDRETKRFYDRTEDASGNVVEFGFDGKKSWRKAAFFKGYLPESDVQAKAAQNRRPPLYEYRESNRKFDRLPNENISGKEYFVLKTIDSDTLGRAVESKYYFDAETFLLRQLISGGAITQTTVYDDYRKVDGKTVAFSTTITNPQLTVKTKITSIKYNVQADSSKFEFREDSAAPPKQQSELIQPVSTPKAESPTGTAANNASVLPESLRLETFELVWKTINDSYWDKTFGGVDWLAAREKYLPLVKATVMSDEYHRLLDRMLGELRRSHLKIIKPANTLGLHSGAGDVSNVGKVGLNLRWIDSQLIVFDVEQDSSAFGAGIRKGFMIEKINGKTPDEIFAEYKKNNQGFQLREEIGRVRAASQQLAGEPETKVVLEVSGDKNARLTLEVVRKRASRNQNPKFESRRLDANVGYVKFSLFFGDVLEKFQAALSELKGANGIIIDLRGNPGGAGQIAPSMANLLSAQPGSLGDFVYRYEKQPVSYKGAGRHDYTGKIVVLVDEMSSSTSEVFAAGLQEQKRAAVVGATTAGAVLPSLVTLLPTGGAFQYVVSNFQTPKGVVLEGRGVTPDTASKPSRADLLAGRDTALEAAINELKLAANSQTK